MPIWLNRRIERSLELVTRSRQGAYHPTACSRRWLMTSNCERKGKSRHSNPRPCPCIYKAQLQAPRSPKTCRARSHRTDSSYSNKSQTSRSSKSVSTPPSHLHKKTRKVWTRATLHSSCPMENPLVKPLGTSESEQRQSSVRWETVRCRYPYLTYTLPTRRMRNSSNSSLNLQ